MKNKAIAFSFIFLFLNFSSTLLFAENQISQDAREKENQAKLDELYSACMQQKKKDKLCDSVITAKQIGNDSVEYIKEYMKLSPAAYAALTLANMIATGRFRIKSKSFFYKKADHIYDYKTKDNTITLIYEQRF